MLKRGGKSSYNPYSTGQRVKKSRDRLDILPNKHSVWLKQVCLSPGKVLSGCSRVSREIFSN